MRYYRLPASEGTRLVARDGRTAYDLSTTEPAVRSFRDLARVAALVDVSVDDLAGRLTDDAAVVDLDRADDPVRPAVPDEIWAAGVTYEVSNEAREEESGRDDIYGDVYDNDRPELFFKATPDRTVGPREPVGIRGDSGWNVPEPELAVVVYDGDVVGYTVGNDVSSRELEGENPLYLPQAKIYDRCCAIGPAVASTGAIEDPHDLDVEMTIQRDEDVVFRGSTSTANMVRSCEELVGWLTRHNDVGELAVLLTGTSIVPSEEFTLREGDRVTIGIEAIGTLENPVTVV